MNRIITFIVAFVVTLFFSSFAFAQDAIFSRLDQPTIDSDSIVSGGTIETKTKLTLLFTLKDASEPSDGLKSFLENESNYAFAIQRRGTQNNTSAILDKTVTGNALNDLAVVEKKLGQWRVTYTLANNSAAKIVVSIKSVPSNSGFQVMNKDSNVTSATIELGAPATFKDLLPATFDLNTSYAYGSSGPALSINGEGRLSAKPGRMTTLSIGGEVPITVPTDVKKILGAYPSASGKQPDGLQVGVNIANFDGTQLRLAGLRARTQATIGSGKTFDGSEVVAYYAPIAKWSKDNRIFHAVEVEGGWRDGTKEWKNLTTRGKDVGNFVGRIGLVGEWQPKIGRINLNPSEKVRFFARGRYWIDSINEGKNWRGRGYIDSELFFNFGKSNRLFLRGEYGMLPPDLSRSVSRASIGVGKSF
jgi:hypothetical protein